MSTTQAKRQAFPLRYARKDARRAIYVQLFGVRENRMGSNIPDLDHSRRLNSFWVYSKAEQVFNDLIDLAVFPKARRTELEARLAHLKSHKPKHILD